MGNHHCISNPCIICFPEKIKEEALFIPYIPKIEDTNKIWTLRYKDENKVSAPWVFWKTTDKPSDIMIEALKKEGMCFLEVTK